MNKQIIRQVLAIDCGQKEFVVALAILDIDQKSHFLQRGSFTNNPAGIKKLIAWVKRHARAERQVQYLVEATGVYHLELINTLHDKDLYISVVHPRLIHRYMESLAQDTINDITSAEGIGEYGLRHPLKPWQKPAEELLTLRNLMREREQLLDQRTTAKNQLHAASTAMGQEAPPVKRLVSMINFIDEQMTQIMKEADRLVAEHAELKKRIGWLLSIPGVGNILAYTVVGETLGFAYVLNQRQLVSYAGLDIRTKDSGTSVHHRPKISKRGNRHIRKALYFPAFTAIRYNDKMARMYERLVDKHGVKMKGAVAVQRKVLVLMYTLWSREEVYNPKIGKITLVEL